MQVGVSSGEEFWGERRVPGVEIEVEESSSLLPGLNLG